MPPPTIAALVIRVAVRNCGPLRFSPLLMATILCSRPGHYGARPDRYGKHPNVTTLEIAGASPAGTFFDFSPLQLVTSASLERVGAAHAAGRVDVVRYRPNIVIETAAALTGFVENDWAGHRLHLGPEVILDVLIPSPRCAVPTLRHGLLPSDPDAFRVPLQYNFVPVPLEGFGAAPCLGVHAGVLQGGRLSPGDEVRLAN